MPEETITTPTTTTTTTETDAGRDADATGSVARLEGALAKERERANLAEKQSRDNAKWRTDREAADGRAAEDKAKADGDLQKQISLATERAANAERERDATSAASWSLVVRANARAEAAKQGAIDPEDVLPFLGDLAAIERDDAGEPKGLHGIVKAILDKKPHFKRAEGGNGGPPATGRGNTATVTPEQDIQRAAAELAGTGLYKRF